MSTVDFFANNSPFKDVDDDLVGSPIPIHPLNQIHVTVITSDLSGELSGPPRNQLDSKEGQPFASFSS